MADVTPVWHVGLARKLRSSALACSSEGRGNTQQRGIGHPIFKSLIRQRAPSLCQAAMNVASLRCEERMCAVDFVALQIRAFLVVGDLQVMRAPFGRRFSPAPATL